MCSGSACASQQVRGQQDKNKNKKANKVCEMQFDEVSETRQDVTEHRKEKRWSRAGAADC